VYDKSALLHLKNSPLSRTPPRQMAHIPGLTKNTAPETHPEPPAPVAAAPPTKPAEDGPKPGTAAEMRLPLCLAVLTVVSNARCVHLCGTGADGLMFDMDA